MIVLSTPAFAEDKCNVKAVFGGKPVTMKHCAAAVFVYEISEHPENQHGVTLYFSDAPFTAKELDSFHASSYATDKNEAGKPRTMMHFAFCPGGGKPAASGTAVKSVATSVNHADYFMVSRQWVFELPKDNENLKFEKLTGNIVPGGTISGRITGGKVSDGSKYSWDASFDFTLPAKDAAAGPGCAR